MKDPLAVLNAIHQVVISAGAPSVDENLAGCNGKTIEKLIVSQSPANSRYISYIYSYIIPILSLFCVGFGALALDFGRIDFRSLLANDYRHGIAVRREDFRLGKPRWQHGAKV